MPAARPFVGLAAIGTMGGSSRPGGALEQVTRRFCVDACSALDAAVSARALRHGNQPELNVAVARWSLLR